LVGLNNLREIFYDRRLSSQTVAGTIAQVARKAWKNKIQIAGIFTILVLLFVIARITVPPANDNPVAADLVGEKLFIRNSVGELLEQIEVGSATVAKALGPDGKPDPRKICRFFDIDGDGKNEFLYTEDSNPDTGFVSRLYCRSLWRKLTRWQISFREPYSFPRNPVGYRQHLTIDNFIVGKFDRDGTPEIFVTAHDMFFPCVVYKLNALTGRVLASYLHIGHLSVLGATDMNGDGSPEIVIAGWNNAFEMTAVAVLDPRLISGHSPLKETYKPENVKDGTEVFYVLIPPTTNAESMEDRPMNAGPQGLEVDTRRKTFNLTIADLQVTLPASRQVLTGSLICTFDSTMRVTNVNSTTTWDHAAQVLHKEGRLSKVPDAAYFNGEFARSMLYWDGDHWQHSPVMNKRYVKALKDMGLN
ncbi:MAG TPA: VCBS repeat-containing protein, partial [Bacteroidota bacterium]